jgi:N-acetyl-gamma-glutamyl-phosphate reductase
MSKTPVVIYGAGGYGGVGLVENLLQHPNVEITALVSREGAGEAYTKLYPHLKGRIDLNVEHAESFEPKGRGAFVFFSTPDGVGQTLAPTYLQHGYKVIDFSGDFRFNSPDLFKAYSAWQQGEMDHLCPELLSQSVYGSPEWNRKALSTANIVGNPGCMAISCLMALYPAILSQEVLLEQIVLDVKTGISGAGKKPSASFHFPAADGNAFAYKIGQHQHLYEIEKHIELWSGKNVAVNFTPHVIPLTRGILSTCTLKLKPDANPQKMIQAYHNQYDKEPFVDIDSTGIKIDLSQVRGSNLCKLSVNYIERTHSLVIVSIIDNLQKGQSGNAIQVMNCMLGLDETTGLDVIPRYP